MNEQKGEASPKTLIASSLRDFEILKKLGQGAQGTVYKVRRKKDENTYVLKQIQTVNMQNEKRRECVNEAILLNKLNSSYIVRYYDSFLEGTYLNIVMEYCDQGDLENFIKNQMGRPLVEKKIWKFFFQISEGLLELHSRNILHRDIKTMNIFLTGNEQIRIGDLGVAKQLADSKSHAHAQVGTPYYMSPEIIQDIPYNEKSDVWSLGCVLYELSTFRKPFEATNQGSLMLKIQKAQYIPISLNYSPQLHKLIEKCLTKDHLKRPSIYDLLSDPETQMKAKQIGHTLKIPDRPMFQANGSNSSTSKSTIPASIQSKNVILFSKQEKHTSDSSPIKQTTSSSPLPHSIGSSFLKAFESSDALPERVKQFNIKVHVVGSSRDKDTPKSLLDKKMNSFAQRSYLLEKIPQTSINSPDSIFSASRKSPIKTQFDEKNNEATPKRKEFSKDPAKKSHFSTLPSVQGNKNGGIEMLDPPKEQQRITLLTENSKTLKIPFDKFSAAVNNTNSNDLQSQPMIKMSTQQEIQINQVSGSPAMRRSFYRINSLKDSSKTKNSFSMEDKLLTLAPLKQTIITSFQPICSGLDSPDLEKKNTKINYEELINGSQKLIGATFQRSFPQKRTKSFITSNPPRQNTNTRTTLNSKVETIHNSSVQGVKTMNASKINQTTNNSFCGSKQTVSQMEIEIPKQSPNPHLQKLYKQKYDLQVQNQQLSKTCIGILGMELFQDVLNIFKLHINTDQELSNQEHEQINAMIDNKLKNKKDCANKFYQLISIENELNNVQDQILSIELQN